MNQQAKLVLESRGLAPEVRNVSFTDYWSRLYRSNKHFIDVSCQPQGDKIHLQGHLLLANGHDVQGGGEIVLFDQKKREIHRARLDKFGQFSLVIKEQGQYQLAVHVGKISIHIPKFDTH